MHNPVFDFVGHGRGISELNRAKGVPPCTAWDLID